MMIEVLVQDSPACNKKSTQELVLFRPTQGIPFIWMFFNEHGQIPSGLKTMRDASGFFRIQEMKYIDVYVFECLTNGRAH